MMVNSATAFDLDQVTRDLYKRDVTPKIEELSKLYDTRFVEIRKQMIIAVLVFVAIYCFVPLFTSDQMVGLIRGVVFFLGLGLLFPLASALSYRNYKLRRDALFDHIVERFSKQVDGFAHQFFPENAVDVYKFGRLGLVRSFNAGYVEENVSGQTPNAQFSFCRANLQSGRASVFSGWLMQIEFGDGFLDGDDLFLERRQFWLFDNLRRGFQKRQGYSHVLTGDTGMDHKYSIYAKRPQAVTSVVKGRLIRLVQAMKGRPVSLYIKEGQVWAVFHKNQFVDLYDRHNPMATYIPIRQSLAGEAKDIIRHFIRPYRFIARLSE